MSETTEEQEHLAVRIRHRGQCPLEKGHESLLVPGVVCGLVAASLVIGAVNIATYVDREKEAILRGYATRDPITREFKWR